MSRGVRVLYVIDSVGSGGAEHSLRALVPPLVGAGHELVVVTLGPTDVLADPLREAGAEVVLPERSLSWTGAVAHVRAEIGRRHPDLVHTTLFRSDVAGRLAALSTRTPVVSSLVNSSYGPEHRGDPALRRSRVLGAQALDAATAVGVRRFHTLSEHVAEVMGRRLAIPRRKLEVIPRGRDPEALGRWSPDRRAEVRARLGIDDDVPLVLAAARHEYQKGLDVLVRAMPAIVADHPDAVVLIAGRRGNQSAELERLAAEVDRQLRIASEPIDVAGAGHLRFLGRRDDVADLMVAADVFVMPSRWEGLGSVLVEAMATEVPIVASAVPAVRETVSGLGGVRLVPPGDVAALAGAVSSTLAQPPGERRAHGPAARRRFEARYTAAAVAEQMIAFWQRSLA